MKTLTWKPYALASLSIALLCTALAGCGGSPSSAPIERPTHPLKKHGTPVKRSSCAGTVMFGRPDQSRGTATFGQLASTPCVRFMTIVPTGVPIGWIARLKSTSQVPASLSMTVTRTSGPGEHPLAVYSSNVTTKRRHVLEGQLTKPQMKASHITPAVYSATFKSGGDVVAHSNFQLGNPAAGMAHGY